MANKTVIEGSDGVKASQLKELCRQIDEKIVTGRILQNFLEKKNAPFLEALCSYLREEKYKRNPCSAMVLAVGVIIIHDTQYREYDIFFDKQIWETVSISHKELNENLGVIWKGKDAPHMHDFQSACELAKRELRNIKRSWFPNPKVSEFKF